MARVPRLSLLLLVLLCTAGVCTASQEVEEEVADAVEEVAEEATQAAFAHLVFSKTVSDSEPVVGSDVTVKLEVFNPSASPAYGVQLRDVAWQAGTLNVAVDAAPGAVTEARFATVPAGGNVSHTYDIVVKSPGLLFGPPARLTYRPSVDASSEQGVYSTFVQLRIISQSESLVNKLVVVGTYASLGVLRTHIAWRNALATCAVFAIFLGTVNIYRGCTQARRRSKARAAEAALLKGE